MAAENHHNAASTASRPATTRKGKREEFARYQQATPAHSMVAALNRIQKVPNMCLRRLSAKSSSCCPIPITNPAAHATLSQRISPAQTEAIPASNARTDHARERKSRDMCCSSPRCWLRPYPFFASTPCASSGPRRGVRHPLQYEQSTMGGPPGPLHETAGHHLRPEHD